MTEPLKFWTFNAAGRRVTKAIVFKKKYATIDNALLTSRTIPLDAEPIDDSELVHVNGLAIDDGCYTVSGASIVFNVALNLEVGDFIDIRYIN